MSSPWPRGRAGDNCTELLAACGQTLQMDLTESQKRAVTRMAASLELEERHSADPQVRAIADFRPEVAVALAADLLADGIETPNVVALASLPADVRDLHRSDVEPLARSMLAELGVSLPPVDTAAWVVAEGLARNISDGSMAPGPGASQLWHLWIEMGAGPLVGEVAEMLPLSELWEESVGPRRLALEDDIRTQAERIIVAAENELAGDP
jgi:hypothetical protein